MYDTPVPTDSGAGGISAAVGIISLAVIVLWVASLWRIFSKAGQPGWAAIIPIYNLVVFLKVIGRPVWWLVLYLIPVVNIIIGIINAIDLAKSFGKGGAFGFFGLFLFAIIGYPVLAFSGAQYVGPAAAARA